MKERDPVNSSAGEEGFPETSWADYYINVSLAPSLTLPARIDGGENAYVESTFSLPPVMDPPFPWRWSTRKYFNIFRVSLIERMTYRGDFFLGSVLRFFPMITTILFWQAVYAGAGKHAQEKFADFSLQETVAYLLLIHISRMFSSMPGLAPGIARDIRDGNLKKYLLQPLDMIGYLIAYRAAHKVAYITTSFLPYALLFYLCSGYFDGFPDALTTIAYVASLLMAFVIGFFFEAAMGMIGFWFLEVTSILWVVNTVNFFVSGQMFPLEFLPAPVVAVLNALPFPYIAHFPAVVFLRKVQGMQLVWGLCWQFMWAVLMVIMTRGLFHRGLRRYSAFGG